MVFGGVLFVVDRVAANAAEDRIAAEVKKELVARKVNSATDPEVRLSGFPFLTQVIGGRYERITIDIDRPEIDLVKLTTLRVVATDIRADARSLLRGAGDVIADRVTGTASMTWEQVRPLLELANLPTAVDPSVVDLKVLNNQIELRVPLAVSGFRTTIIAKGQVTIEAGRVRLRLTDVATDTGNLPAAAQNLIRQYQQRLTVTIRVPALPYSMVVNRVESSDTGLQMTASADKVSLSKV
jgi:hypothetical protein